MHRPGTRLRSSDPLHLYGSDLHNIAYLHHPAVGGIALGDHLIGDHHRSEPEIDGLTLEGSAPLRARRAGDGPERPGPPALGGRGDPRAGRRGCERGRPPELSMTPDGLDQSTS